MFIYITSHDIYSTTTLKISKFFLVHFLQTISCHDGNFLYRKVTIALQIKHR